MRKIFFKLLYYTGFGHLSMFINRKKNKIPILVFHRVSPTLDNYWMPLHPDQFELIITFLARKYTFIPLDKIFHEKKEKLKNSCVIVFDDAFTDFKTHAFPIIKKYNVPVTMFAPTGCIDQQEIIWTSQLDNCFKFTTKKELSLLIGNKTHHYYFANDQDKTIVAFKLQQLFKTLPDKERRAQLEKVKVLLGYSEDPNISIMTWEDIRECSSIVDFQSHSVSHPALASIEDETTLTEEIAESKATLSKELNRDIRYFSYPMGDYSEKVLKITKTHYKAGFAVHNKLVNLNQINNEQYKYEIPRINVHDANPHELFFRINGFHSFFIK